MHTELINIVLPMLSNPTVENAEFIVSEVIKYSSGKVLTDLDLFKECASLTILENQL